VEFAFSIPFKYKIKWCEDSSKYNSRVLMSDQISEKYDTPKYLLKKAFENKLPNEILYRKKVGFPVPLHNWFDGKFKKYAKTILLSDTAKNRKIYNLNNIKKMLNNGNFHKDNDAAMKIWMLINLELFNKEYFDK
jgi:asparagine synthase (glutamine-hydrolysing)